LENLLRLQALDLKIARYKRREQEIPKQKNKFDVQRKRLDAELSESEGKVKAFQLEEKECEGDIEQRQAQINKYKDQLVIVKKNEEYTALLHEIETVKKEINIREERIITLLVEIDDAKDKLVEDGKRIKAEHDEIASECGVIDKELSEAVLERKGLEDKRPPLVDACDGVLFRKYERIRAKRSDEPVVVPLVNATVCGNCRMAVLPQMVNEVLGGKAHSCSQCACLLYDEDKFDVEAISANV
jgi:predicted  nucleic acid-binding Zn-ribbon protein